jgi:flagellar FliJ protein
MADRKTLDRLLRVREMQLNMVRADEVRAQAKLDSEQTLRSRIAALAENVAPAPAPAIGALGLAAAAHFRDRLHQSAEAADARLRNAAAMAERAAEATREARRDHNAIEKLIERDAAEQALKALRELEEAPPVRRIRHDPC